MSESLADLITAMGDDVKFQNLDQCTTNMDYRAKNGWTITFGTDAPLSKSLINGTERLGLVVWLDRDKVKDFMATPTQES